MTRKWGWASRTGPNGWSFGIYDNKVPKRVDPRHPLAEILAQATSLVLSDKPSGVVAGKEHKITRSVKGERAVRLITPWMSIEIAKKSFDACTMTWNLPVEDGDGKEVVESDAGMETVTLMDVV